MPKDKLEIVIETKEMRAELANALLGSASELARRTCADNLILAMMNSLTKEKVHFYADRVIEEVVEKHRDKIDGELDTIVNARIAERRDQILEELRGRLADALTETIEDAVGHRIRQEVNSQFAKMHYVDRIRKVIDAKAQEETERRLAVIEDYGHDAEAETA